MCRYPAGKLPVQPSEISVEMRHQKLCATYQLLMLSFRYGPDGYLGASVNVHSVGLSRIHLAERVTRRSDCTSGYLRPYASWHKKRHMDVRIFQIERLIEAV